MRALSYQVYGGASTGKVLRVAGELNKRGNTRENWIKLWTGQGEHCEKLADDVKLINTGVKMKASKRRETTYERENFTIYDEWEKFRITKHLGTIQATRRLIEWCGITPGQYVLDVGCGTGYTACLLAKKYQVDVVAADITPTVLEEAKKRIARGKVSDKVKVVEADAHALPFPSHTFDAVLAESVLVFCEKAKVSSEVYRVLKPDGIFGDNEVTYVKPPPVQLRSLTSKLIRTDAEVPQEDEWRAIYGEAGFDGIHSTVYPLHSTVYIKESFDGLRMDGIRRRLSALLKAFSDPTWRRTFLMDRDSRQARRQLLPYMGYGLYVSGKP
jgi:ubiquinone/menaquinone biosynthesis C-methylase UbiE